MHPSATYCPGTRHQETATIYLILNTHTGDAYVGKAEYLRDRWSLHFKQIEKREHHSPRLQASYDACGRSAFTIHILEFCKIEDAPEQEREWMMLLRPALNTIGPHVRKAKNPKAPATRDPSVWNPATYKTNYKLREYWQRKNMAKGQSRVTKDGEK